MLSTKISASKSAEAAAASYDLYMWGHNDKGQLGHDSGWFTPIPTQIYPTTDWLKIGGSIYHTLLIKTDGTLWSMGQGLFGELGDGTNVRKSSPVQIGSLTTWSKIYTGFGSNISGAIKTDGTLWMWGQNANGIIADGTTVNKSSPVQVGSLTDWAEITLSTNGGNASAIKTDGTLWT